MSELHILDMSVTWKNILDLGELPLKAFENQKEIESKLVADEVIPQGDEIFTTLQRVSHTVCSLISAKKLFLPLFPLEICALPNVERMESEQILEKLEKVSWTEVQLSLLLHKSGIGMIKTMGHFPRKQTVPEAIQTVRKGIKKLVIKVPNKYLGTEESPYIEVIERGASKSLLVASLRTFISFYLREYIRRHLGEKYLGADFGEIRFQRCISNTMIEVYKTDPTTESVQDFLDLGKFGRELRGVGAMDLAYTSRADQVVQSTFETNLSQDEELHFYLMGLSDFLIYDNRMEEMLPMEKKRLKVSSDFLAIKYTSYHYECLMDWVYVEQYLLRMYDMLLSRSMARENIQPLEMLNLQKHSMRDLIEYTEGITPFATRADILERARVMYRIPEEQERLEKKRDMVTEYVMQEYSLKTNRGIQVLNLIVSASISFELMQLVIQVAEAKDTFLWSVTSSLVFMVLLGLFLLSYSKVVGK